MNKKVKIILIVVLTIIALILGYIQGINLDMNYDEHKKIEIYLGKDFEKSEINSMVKEVFGNTNYSIEKIGTFEEMVQISVKDLNDEQKEKLEQLLSEKYGIEKEDLSTEIINIPKMEVIDIFKNSIIMIIVSIILVALYYLIRYKKVSNVVKFIINLVLIQILLWDVLIIARLPISIYVNSISLVLLILTVLYSNYKIEKEV